MEDDRFDADMRAWWARKPPPHADAAPYFRVVVNQLRRRSVEVGMTEHLRRCIAVQLELLRRAEREDAAARAARKAWQRDRARLASLMPDARRAKAEQVERRKAEGRAVREARALARRAWARGLALWWVDGVRLGRAPDGVTTREAGRRARRRRFAVGREGSQG